MNRNWRGKDKATDVLSFPQQEVEALRVLARAAKKGSHESWSLGDVVISMEKAKEQAKEKGLSLSKELEILFIHGLLHLLGYDHETNEREARRMQRLERKLLTQ